MINLIPGKKGTGKTKILVDSIVKAAENATGNVVCIERGMKLTYDIPHSVRLVDALLKWQFDEIMFLGIATDICVISNVMLAKAYLPNANIAVKADCCAGITPETHEAALKVMQMCQIDII